MADLDFFENSNPEQQEDPAADFLAQEQNQLAGIDGEDFGFNQGSEQEPQDAQTDFTFVDAAADPSLVAEQNPEPADPYASIKVVDTQEGEPEKIRIWREEQKKRLEEKDAEEAEKILEWRAQASKELDDWYKHRTDQLEKTRAGNREGEAEFIRLRDDTVPGHEWERVCRLCEFNPKSSRSTRDVSRMRSIMVQLKQSPLVKSQ